MTNEACWRVVGAFQRGHWIAGAAIEFYKTNIAASRTDGTSRKMLDYCRCRLQREYDSRVQPLAPSGKARTEVHSGALASHAYAGRDRCCQDHPVAPPVSAARRCAQSHFQDVQRGRGQRALSVDVCRAACSCCLLLLLSLVHSVRAPLEQRPCPPMPTVRVCPGGLLSARRHSSRKQPALQSTPQVQSIGRYLGGRT